jgi:ATP-dependent DNA helicase PIF1
MELSIEQQNAFNLFKQGKNLFITGPGGTGKTALIRLIVNYAKENNLAIQVCAMTGCAAVLLNCNAKTLHSWAGIGLGKGKIDEQTEKVVRNKLKVKNWISTNILIIDEVSMLSKKLLLLLDSIAKRAKKNPFTPFGGMQIVFSGDFYQLPPIGQKDEPDTSEFCFESPLWKMLFNKENTILLKTIFRQDDELYIKALCQIREGILTKSSYNALLSCVSKTLDLPDEMKPTILLPIRSKVEMINNSHLNHLENEEVTITYKNVVDDISSLVNKEQKQIRFNTSANDIEYEQEYLINNCMCDRELKLKIGAQVMCVINLDMEGESGGQICNGSQGIVVGFDKGFPRVKYLNGHTRLMNYHTWYSEKIPGVGIKQVPLILAWALTIHKAQGATLEYAEVDAGSSIFECGQVYVALSRVKSLNGLSLKSFNPQKIKVNKKVQDFYNSITNT